GRLPAEIELTLFRVLQEALANIALHSRSKTALIALTAHRAIEGDYVGLRIEDHGVGFSPSGFAIRRPGEIGAKGVGLASMTERVRQVDGQLQIQSAVGRTVIQVRIPLPSENATAAAGNGKSPSPASLPP